MEEARREGRSMTEVVARQEGRGATGDAMAVIGGGVALAARMEKLLPFWSMLLINRREIHQYKDMTNSQLEFGWLDLDHCVIGSWPWGSPRLGFF